MYRHSSILLETPEGSLLFHHRDNKPDIANPNMIGTFGGGVEDGENYEDAAIRELKEELQFQFNKTDLKKLVGGDYIQKDGKKAHKKLFLIKNVNRKNLALNPNEGQGIIAVSGNDNLNEYNFTRGVKEALNYYWKTNLQ